jgi:tetratricopeptide (TPR) repeat protein
MKRFVISILVVLFFCIVIISGFIVYVSRDVFDDILVMKGCEYNLEGKYRIAKAHFFIAKLLGKRGYEIYTVLGTSYYDLGQYEKAAKEFKMAFDDVATQGHDYGVGSLLAASYAHLGKTEQSLEICAYIIKKLREDDAFNRYNIACAYSIMGDRESALHYLEEAIVRDPAYSKMAKEDKDFVNLKNDLRFRELIDRYYTDMHGESVPFVLLDSNS